LSRNVSPDKSSMTITGVPSSSSKTSSTSTTFG
jgi:hypothetical protein